MDASMRRRVRHVIRNAWALIPLVVALSGCDLAILTPEPTPPTVEPTATLGPQATEPADPGIKPLRFWEPFALDRPQGLLLGEMVRDFEAENPDILIELVPKSGYVGIHGAMLAALEGGDLPDFAVAFPSMIAEYAAAGVVLPMEPFLVDPDFGLSEADLSDIFPGFLDAGRFPDFGRRMLAFPFSYNAIGMWVNEDLLRQAGWEQVPRTWSEFEQACFDVFANTGARCYPFIESASTFSAWVYSRGGEVLDDSGRRAAFNSPAGVESLALLRRLIDAGLAWRPEDTYGDYVAFANGQAPFTFSSTGNTLLYLDAYEGALQNGVAPFRWYQTMIPQADPQAAATNLYGGSFFIVPGEPEREQASWRFVRWFTETRQAARWAASLQSMPPRLSALDMMTDTLQAHPFVEIQIEGILPHARPEPAVAEELEVRDILYTAILSVTAGYLDPQTALDQAAAEVNTVLSRQP
jgi:ABC-type glycerol-3-phosphate transport system substrate-binding protein